MQRPSLNPQVIDLEAAGPPPLPRRAIGEIVRSSILGILLFEFTPAHRPGNAPRPKTFGRVGWSIFRGIVLLPVLVPAMVAVLVYIGTHGRISTSPLAGTASNVDPSTKGVYYDPVAFVSQDEVALEGWFVPVVDEKNILERREGVLVAKRPGVLLAPDTFSSQIQMLPLMRPLQESGFIVLVMRMRSQGPAARAQTFGMRESADVKAAINLLRRMPGVDGDRIGIVATGTGACAAMLAAEADGDCSALVLDNPPSPDALMAQNIVPPRAWLTWMRPLCKWGFELSYQLDLDELSLDRHRRLLGSQSVLLRGDQEPIARQQCGNNSDADVFGNALGNAARDDSWGTVAITSYQHQFVVQPSMLQERLEWPDKQSKEQSPDILSISLSLQRSIL